ncbi:hypothetical protein ScPMuIL_008217 [Solemya velum]
MDLFGDLPEPSGDGIIVQIDPAVRDAGHTENETTDKGEKRKFEAGDSQPNSQTTKQRLSVKYEVKAFAAERKGEREEMQDAHVIINDFTDKFTNLDPSISRIAVYAIFDGHGGARASRFASENLHKNFRDKFPKGDIEQVEREMKKTLIDVFKKTDEDFLKEASQRKPSWKDGTTATFVLVINDIVYVANLGDSEALLCRYKEDTQKSIPISLTTNHNPSVYGERVRIQKVGGTVREGRIMGILEISRSIGDGQFKKHGVSCVPDVKKCILTDADRFILVACDGLWKSFSPEESLEFVAKVLKQQAESDMSLRDDESYQHVCTALANRAVLRLTFSQPLFWSEVTMCADKGDTYWKDERIEQVTTDAMKMAQQAEKQGWKAQMQAEQAMKNTAFFGKAGVTMAGGNQLRLGGTLINIAKCENIQVGNHNTMIINDTRRKPRRLGMEETKKLDKDLEEDTSSLPVMSSTRVAGYSEFMIVALHLGTQWKRLFRNLDMDDDVVEEIEMNFKHSGVKEVIVECLKNWKHQNGSNAHVCVLAQALSSIGHNDIVRKLES